MSYDNFDEELDPAEIRETHPARAEITEDLEVPWVPAFGVDVDTEEYDTLDGGVPEVVDVTIVPPRCTWIVQDAVEDDGRCFQAGTQERDGNALCDVHAAAFDEAAS